MTYWYISVTCGACMCLSLATCHWHPLATCCWMHSLMCFDNSCDPWSCRFSWAQIKEVGQGRPGRQRWHRALGKSHQMHFKTRTNQACWTDMDRLCCLAESSEWRGSVNCQNVLGHVRTVRPNKNPCSWLGVCRKCAESSLDCFAFLGRGAVATGGAVATVTKQCAHLARMCSL